VRNLLVIIGITLLSACGGGGSSNALPATPTAPSTTVPVSPAPEPSTLSGMLETHNQARAAVAVMPLTWSSQMSNYAQEWATYLANNNNCEMKHRAVAGNAPLNVGENLYWGSAVRWSDGRTDIQAITPSQVATAWADEKADYDYANDSCAPGKACGHYTQMVWNTTTEVGCGMAICPDKGQIWVCNYNPPGNYVGIKPY